MTQTNLFKGIVAYPITPFDENDQVDLGKFKAMLDRLIENKVHAVAPLGSAGSLPYLSDEEREAVTEATVQTVNRRVPVLIGVSSLTTERTVHHAKFAERAGADAVMIIPMSYWKLTGAEIFRHYETIAEAISIPIMVYNNPATGGIDLSPELIARLLEIPNVTMVKESTGDVQRMYRLRELIGEDLAIYNGSNPLALAGFAAGAAGWSTAAANLIPQLNIELYEAVVDGNSEEARRVFYRQLPLLRFIVRGGLPRTIAAGLELLGFDAGRLRLPLLPLTDGELAELKEILDCIHADDSAEEKSEASKNALA